MHFLTHKKYEVYILSALVFAISAGVIWVRTATVTRTYQYVQQDRELRRLQQDLQGDRVKWLRLTAPRRLESIAHRLGLFPPTIQQTIKIANRGAR